MHFCPLVPWSTTPNLEIIYKQTQEDCKVERRRQTGLGPWNPRNKTTVSSRVSFLPHISQTWSWKNPKPGNATGSRQQISKKREENLGPTLLRKGMEDPLSIHPWGRVNRVPFLVSFLLDSWMLKKGGRACLYLAEKWKHGFAFN